MRGKKKHSIAALGCAACIALVAAAGIALIHATRQPAPPTVFVSEHVSITGTGAFLPYAPAMLEQLHVQLKAFFPDAPTPKNFRVVVYPSREAYLAGIPVESRRSLRARQAAGIYSYADGKCHVWLNGDEHDVRNTLIHECVHQYRDSMRPRSTECALVEEGIAEYLADHQWEGGKLFIASGPRLSDHRFNRALERFDVVHRGELSSLIESGLESVNYDDAWALTSYLLTREPANYRRLLAQLDAGAEFKGAWEDVFNSTYDAQSSAFHEYLRYEAN